MIKVNLLPEDRRKRVKKRRKVSKPVREIPVMAVVIGLLAVLGTCFILLLWHWTLGKKVNVINGEIAGIEKKIKALDVDISDVEDFKKQKGDLEEKLGVIKQLENRKKGPIHFMDQLASAVPPRLWLNEVSENGNSMSLVGLSTDHAQISVFMGNLEKSPFFSNVELAGVQSAKGKGRKSGPSDAEAKTFQLVSAIHLPNVRR
jgi:type IV pilus assembly protein PilN